MFRWKDRFATLALVWATLLAWVTPSLAQPFAYIPASQLDEVRVIDTVTNTLVATIPVGTTPLGVSVNPDGTRVYVSNRNSSSLSVIDTATNSVIATVGGIATPTGVVVHPSGSPVYVIAAATNAGKAIVVIDAATNTETARIPAVRDLGPIDINPAGTRLYACYPAQNQLWVFDTTTNSVVTTLQIAATGVAVAPSGDDVYVSSSSDGIVSVIDTATNTVRATISGLVNPNQLAADPSGARVYVSEYGADRIAVIDTATNTVIQTLPTGDGPIGIAVDPTGALVYTLNQFSKNATVVDIATGASVATISLSNTISFGYGKFIGPLPPGCIEPPAGLVSWWPANSDVLDAGYLNDATLVNGASYGPGKVGDGFDLNGTNEWVTIADAPELRPQTFTLEAWVKVDSTVPSYQTIMGKGLGAGPYNSFAMGVEFGQFRIYGQTALGSFASPRLDPVTAGEFFHAAMTWDGSTARAYYNGALVSQVPVGATTIEYDSNPVRIGSDIHNGNVTLLLGGVIDEPTIYDRPLADNEIAAIFEAGSVGKCLPEPPDTDGDGVTDDIDNCPDTANADQLDTDGDGIGDACDTCIESPAGLVSWWPADSDSFDAGNVHDGTLVNGATFGPGKVGDGFDLNGIDEWVEIADAPELRPQTFTIEAWVNLDSTAPSYQTIIGKGLGTGPYNSFAMGIEFGQFRIYGDTALGSFASPRLVAVTAGEFFHAAMTWDGSTARAYYNGVVVSEVPVGATTIVYDNNPVRIGSDIHNGNVTLLLGGIIDEATIYDRPLTDGEIAAIVTAGSNGKCLPEIQDVDGDGVADDVDNCPSTANADQLDSDGDGNGDACDVCAFDAADDIDGDGICADVDNCPDIANGSQLDADGDGIGDACDACPNDPYNDADDDGICADVDNCPLSANADQLDYDGDGAGDACDPNVPPTAECVVAELVTAIGDEVDVSFNGDATDEEDDVLGLPLSFAWTVETVPDGAVVATSADQNPTGVVLDYGDYLVTLTVTDSLAATATCTKNLTINPADLAVFECEKVEVRFCLGDDDRDNDDDSSADDDDSSGCASDRVKIKGEIGLPMGVDYAELDAISVVEISVAGGNFLPAPLAMAPITFEVRGGNGDHWKYRDESATLGVKKFEIDWKGARFKYKQSGVPVEFESELITSSETVLEMEYKMNDAGGPFTVDIGGVVLDVDADGVVTSGDLAAEAIVVKKNGKKVLVTLPFPLTAGSSVTFGGSVAGTVLVADHYTSSLGRFKLEVESGTALPQGAETPTRNVDLWLGIGGPLYPGSCTSDAEALRVHRHKWKARH